MYSRKTKSLPHLKVSKSFNLKIYQQLQTAQFVLELDQKEDLAALIALNGRIKFYSH